MKLMTMTVSARRRLGCPAAALLGLFTALIMVRPVGAAPVTGIAGFDHFAGAAGQTTDGVLGALVLGAAGGDLMLAGVRFDDSDAGRGYGVTGGIGVPLAPMMTLRAAGTRFIGDLGLRAWRARIGPQFSLPGGRTMTVAYAHYRNQLGARSNAAIAELATPLVARLAGRASASYAGSPQGPPVLQGSAGLGWTVARHVEISGEAGLVSSVGGAGSPASPGGGPLGGLPLLGGGNATGGTPSDIRETYRTLSLGVRVTWP